MKLSIIIPIYNEAENIKALINEIEETIKANKINTEIIAVDDGSTDNSLKIIKNIAKDNQHIKIISFSRNFGQTAALSAGFDKALGEIIVPIDADMQNNPKDIPLLLNKLREGYDIVSGWRRKRKDKLFSRKIPSQIANYIISKITKVNLHDYGCTLKAYKRDTIKNVKLYGEMHRFIPALAAWHGAKIAEIETGHRERKFGKTKYGISRTFRVVLDLFTVKFLTVYLTRPMHFFGKIGFYCLFMGLISGLIAVYLKIFYSIYFITTPLPLLTVFSVLVGFQFVLMGLLAEIIIRNYHESQNKPIYIIKEKVNF
ncbi:MAG: glycosyltransferase family 2 protein [Patescibacteria group bacterium]|nr:glycosyltransferase family 2 protein [Patescibacteria group bacterium]